jgi:two-component system, chemotaxis family, chemotaxis protein CheY
METAAHHSEGGKILLCDDSAVERTALARYLRDQDYIVHEVADGNAALEYLKNKTVDLLLLDLHMPQRDGFGVLCYIQEHRRALPVILLSGLPPDQIQHRMNKLPDKELPPLFIKPIDPEKLVQIIDLRLAGELPKNVES